MLERKSFFSLAKRSFAFWFGGIWLFCGSPLLIIGIYVGVNAFLVQKRFEKEAVVTEAMVLEKSLRSNRGGKSCWVGYRFHRADGTVVKNQVQVNAASWDRSVKRGPVSVTYLPDRPTINRIAGAETRWMFALIATGVGLFLLRSTDSFFLKA